MIIIASSRHRAFPNYLLDRQALFTEVYVEGRYDEEIDYTRPVPLPRLTQAEARRVGEQVVVWQ